MRRSGRGPLFVLTSSRELAATKGLALLDLVSAERSCAVINKAKHGQDVEEFRAQIARRLGLKTIQFFNESDKPLDIVPGFDRKTKRPETYSRRQMFLLAASAGLDPRTVLRVMVEGVESMKSDTDKVRIRAAAKQLGITLP